MKGRIGYAIFWSSPGLEKLNILHAHKTSFLKPVTSRFSQRVPFLTRAVDVSRIILTPNLDLLTASTVFFSLVAMTTGRLPVHHHPTDLRVLHAGQRFFLSLWFHSWRTAITSMVLSQFRCPGSPPLFPTPSKFYSVAAPVRSRTLHPTAFGPAVLIMAVRPACR